MKRQDNQVYSKVKLNAEGIYIEEKPRVVLCSSVFYFRIPRAEWRDRLEKVKAAGYNCVDIYFPWNFHESAEGIWDFEGDKDAEAYLKLVAELGLWVIARPGPYICSEWDMGGLPAYLLSKKDIILRDYNELYLSYVKKWYEKIMPVIVKYQLGKQGTVIAVQIENELDFYNCGQIEPYIAALRDYALEAGVEVPLVVCAGQCDIVRAGGMVDGVIPTLNFYPEPQERTLEDRIHHYVDVFREQDLPFCITETSPAHVILRREFGAGAKFIAPYNQVSGTNFGFTPSVNNWGFPLAFMPHDYNLKGMINPQGESTPEYDEAFLLSGLLKAFEEVLGTSRSEVEYGLRIDGDCELSNGIRRTLRFAEGGKLAPIANVEDKPGRVNFYYAGVCRPTRSELTVTPFTCPLLPFDIPLELFGLARESGTLAYSTAEIVHIERQPEVAHVLCYTENQAEVALKLSGSVRVTSDQMDHYQEGGLELFVYEAGQIAKAEIITENGQKLCLYGVSKSQAVRILRTKDFPWNMTTGSSAEESMSEAVSEASIPDVARTASMTKVEATDLEAKEDNKVLLRSLQEIRYRRYHIPGMGMELGGQTAEQQDGCKTMEEMGYYKGFGWYEGKTELNPEEKALGYMIYQGMDVLHLYRNEEYLGSYIGDGNHKFIGEPKTEPTSSLRLGVRSEIWGHSNFSDSRLESMDIRSKKGIRGLSVVTSIEDITENWCYCKNDLPDDTVNLLSGADKFRPLISFGVYNNPEQPQIGVYKKRIKLHPGSNSLVLKLKELHSSAKVYADGQFIKLLQPYDSTVTLDQVCGKEEFELSILLLQKTIQESIKIKLYLYEGKHITEFDCCGAQEQRLAEYMNQLSHQPPQEKGIDCLRDVDFQPGEVAVLSGSFTVAEAARQGLKLKLTGKDAKVLVLLNGIMLGRIWLPSGDLRPFFKGGDDTLLFLPESYLKEDNRLELLVEAMQGEPRLYQPEFENVHRI